MTTRHGALARIALATFALGLAAAKPVAAAEGPIAPESTKNERTATVVRAWITLPDGRVIAAPVRVVPRGEDVSLELRGYGHAHRLDVRTSDGAVAVSYARDGRALLDAAPLSGANEGRLAMEDGTTLVVRIHRTEARLHTTR